MVMGFGAIGKGITAIEKFCTALIMPPLMVNKAYNELNAELKTAAKTLLKRVEKNSV